MVFLSNFFKGTSANEYSKAEIESVTAIAQRLTDIINDSVQLANFSINPETKLSQLALAKEKFEDIKELAAQNSFLELTKLDELEADISGLEYEFMMSGFEEIARENNAGDTLEKEGKTEEAIIGYEKLLKKGVDTPFTYRRLAILYKKANKRDDELRVINAALDNVPKSNLKHYNWFKDRLIKIKWLNSN